MFRDEYFASIRGYLPEAAKNVLDQEIPRIREQVRRDIDDFGKQLQDWLAKEVDSALDAQKKIIDAAREVVELELAQIKTLAAPAGDALASHAGKLKQAIADYEQHWRGMGEKVRGAAVAAIGKAFPL
jgi:hypothetical protein